MHVTSTDHNRPTIDLFPPRLPSGGDRPGTAHRDSVDPETGIDYAALRGRAEQMLRRVHVPRTVMDADDAVQETIARYVAAGGLERVDLTKGTAQTLACGFLFRVVLQAARAAKRRTRALPPDLVDQKTSSPEAALFGPDRSDMEERRDRLLEVWWSELSERRRLAAVRISGELFGRVADRKPTKADYPAKCMAMAQLRRMAVQWELLPS